MSQTPVEAVSQPSPECPLCPRLAEYRRANRAAHADWFNAPVPSFGRLDARLLLVGLAPGVRGANRTGRPLRGGKTLEDQRAVTTDCAARGVTVAQGSLI